MRQVYQSQAPTAKPTEAPARQPEHAEDAEDAEHAEPTWVRYSADEAAFAFEIPRIAPVRSGSPLSAADPAASFAAEVEDVTESLTADEREVPAAAEHDGQDLAQSAEQALSDPVTAALRIPSHADRDPRSAWGGTRRPLLTERLTALPGPALPPLVAPRPRARLTALLPHLGRGPGESATTTLTLPATADSSAPGEPAVTDESLVPLNFRFSQWRWLAFGAGAALVLLLAMLAGRALTLADLWPGPQPPPVAPRPPPAYREHLLSQALTALREGRREQAIALLLRYQASEPANSPDQAVPIMLRVLKKDLGPQAH